jgi:hypothetical protein
MISAFVVLTARLEAAEKALSEEKAARLAADRSLAEEKVAQQIADQSRWSSEEAKAALMQGLLSAQASVTTIAKKLAATSSALDFTVIQECEAEIKLQTSKEKRIAQDQLLESTQKALSKREFSFLVVISSAMVHDVALLKNHMPEFDAEILLKDITIDDAGQEALVDSAYDTAQYLVSLYDFSVLAESDDNASPGAL